MEVLENSIKCSECKDILEFPVLLPCGDSVCSKHVNLQEKEYHCVACDSDHKIPESGFYANKALKSILDTKIQKVKLCPEYDAAYKSCKKLGSSIEKFCSLQNDPYFFINKIINELKGETEILREEYKLKIDEKADRIIDELSNYEQTCKSNLDSNDFRANLNQLKLYTNKIREELDKWQRTLSSFDSTDNEWKQIKDGSEKDSIDIQLKINSFKNDLLMKKLNDYQIKLNDFTKLELNSDKKFTFQIYEDIKFSGSKIIDLDLEKRLLELCEFSMDQKWRLIYRASEHGFSAKSFHSKCDNSSKTLTIVKTNHGYIFGGYSDASWDQSGVYRTDKNAFIYSLVNRDKKPLKIKICKDLENYAICSTANSGPIFGGGQDFFICDNSNVYSSNYTNLGHTYKHPMYTFGSTEARFFLAGAYNFQVSDIEVYRKK